MFTLIVAELVNEFRRMWKLYATNAFCIAVIILLYAYIDGSVRQLHLRSTVFSGEAVVTLNKPADGFERGLLSKVPNIKYVTRKIRSDVTYKAGTDVENATLVGVDLAAEKDLSKYLTLYSGRPLKDGRDIMVPSFLLSKEDIKVGDRVNIMGKTSGGQYNTASYRICGIYNSAGFSLLGHPEFLVTYDAMSDFLDANPTNVEYCLFFKNGGVPENLDAAVRNDVLHDADFSVVNSISVVRLSDRDVFNMALQFNIFLMVIVSLLIIVLVTIVVLVNFNIFTILYREKLTETGTLLSFGVPSWKIALVMYLKSAAQTVIALALAVAVCLLVSLLGRVEVRGGLLEALLVLLSGTNRLDFYVQYYQARTAFLIVLGAVTVSQVPVFFRLLFGNPVDVMKQR